MGFASWLQGLRALPLGSLNAGKARTFGTFPGGRPLAGRYLAVLGFCRLPSWGHELLGGSEIYQGRGRGEGRLWPQDLSIFVQVYSLRHQGLPPKTAGQNHDQPGCLFFCGPGRLQGPYASLRGQKRGSRSIAENVCSHKNNKIKLRAATPL